MFGKILVIDDDESVLKSLNKILKLKSYQVDTVQNPAEIKSNPNLFIYNCILLDVKMPGINGMDLLNIIIKNFPTVPVIMISGQSNINIAVEAIKNGAFDFIEKPIDPEKLLVTIQNAIQKQNLQTAKENIFHELSENYQMVGESRAIMNIFNQIDKVADTNAKVLIRGESGTGKELVAWAIHHNSARTGGKYIRLNCAAVPSELLESELFGHRKGSFTGAVSDRIGKFVAADGGTLFLDEIGDMDIQLQSKLLRAIEENEVEVIGDTEPRKVDVRIVAASNKNLEQLVKEGKFRADLYHRLNVVVIQIPPLRERIEDILPLAYHFLTKFNNSYNKQILNISRQAEALLINHTWPGNVRELRNTIEKTVIFSETNEIKINDVQKALNIENFSNRFNSDLSENEMPSLKTANIEFEKKYILQILNLVNWKISEAAELLHIDRTNLFRKMKKLGITKHK
ncbi:MAG: sigma-54-dependent Fis family transcriptional regulator [Calditrichaceae bacterium]|nr:sigma-54-dependent Fis family transcriptional regulator [Calditrichaceae bacterium]